MVKLMITTAVKLQYYTMGFRRKSNAVHVCTHESTRRICEHECICYRFHIIPCRKSNGILFLELSINPLDLNCVQNANQRISIQCKIYE